MNALPDYTILAEPNALTLRFGFTDQVVRFGFEADATKYPPAGHLASERGISLEQPIADANGQVMAIVEKTHIGIHGSTFGCALYNRYVVGGDAALVTIAPWDWKVRVDANTTADQAYMDTNQLTVMGGITAWKHAVHGLNYTLSHHCETDSERTWDDFRGRLLEWTGDPGGNQHGNQILDWKHGIHNHALSTVTLSSLGETKNWAGVCMGLTADKGADEIHYKGEINNFQKYHGVR